MEESAFRANGDNGASVSEFNNNQLNWKSFDPTPPTQQNSLVMPCNSQVTEANSSSCIESSDFQIININPCYVASISSYQYETFKMETATVTSGPCEKGRLAQMKANTKLKRSRKPYQLPNRSANSSYSYHSRAASLSMNTANSMTCSNTDKNGLNRSQSNRVVHLFDDRPRLPKPNTDVARSRSLEDLRSLAKTTTVCFDSAAAKQESEDVEEVSHVLSNLHVT